MFTISRVRDRTARFLASSLPVPATWPASRNKNKYRPTERASERAGDSFRLLDSEWRICRLRCADREGMNINLAEEEVKEKKGKCLSVHRASYLMRFLGERSIEDLASECCRFFHWYLFIKIRLLPIPPPPPLPPLKFDASFEKRRWRDSFAGNYLCFSGYCS